MVWSRWPLVFEELGVGHRHLERLLFLVRLALLVQPGAALPVLVRLTCGDSGSSLSSTPILRSSILPHERRIDRCRRRYDFGSVSRKRSKMQVTRRRGRRSPLAVEKLADIRLSFLPSHFRAPGRILQSLPLNQLLCASVR